METLEIGTVVYIVDDGAVVRRDITVKPSEKRNYYMVRGEKEHLSPNVDEWPDYVYLDEAEAQAEAKRVREDIYAYLKVWASECTETPEALLRTLYRTWRFVNSHGVPFAVAWQREKMISKIREYFGVDVGVEKE